jgi:glycosyltransferase involved in cell wall biosynthesis
MRILITIGTLGLGGAEKQAVWIANRLSTKNKVTLLTYTGGARESEVMPQVNLVIKQKSVRELDRKLHKVSYKNKKKFFIRILLKSKMTIKRYLPWILGIYNMIFYLYRNSKQVIMVKHDIETFDAQVVITFLYHDTLIAGLATLLSKNKPKLIVNRRSPQGYGDKSRPKLERLLLSLIYKQARVCVSNSTSNLTNAVRDGIEKSKIIIIPNYIETSETKKHASLINSRIVLINIANLIWYKNQFNLLQAIASDPFLRSRVSLKIVGTGPLKNELEFYALENNLDVYFAGQISDTKHILMQSDALVSTSLFEGASNALLEGISVGLPCVTTPVGNISELVSSGATLVICEDFSTDSIKFALRSLIDNFDELNKKSLGFVPKFQEIYAEEKIFGKWEELIYKLLT